MKDISKNHTFVVCAYKENPYLDKCVQSVVNQTVKSRVLITTSTPNAYIDSIARKYNLKVMVNRGKGDAPDNFNFAFDSCDTDYVTICHQDDYYSKHYLEYITNLLKGIDKPLIAFTDYVELHNGIIQRTSHVLRFKRLLLWPLQVKYFQKTKFIRRRILGFGNPFCCPTLLFNKRLIGHPEFSSEYKGASDYDMLERISRLEGAFVYCRKKLLYRRIWDGTDTRLSIDNGCRSMEEKEILGRLWPGFIADIIAELYKNAQKYY